MTSPPTSPPTPPPAPPPTSPSAVSRRPYALVLVALVLGEATGAFEATMLTVAIPQLIEDFDVTTTDVGWAVTLFFLVAGASAAVGGRLGDLFGRKKVLIIVLLVSVLGSVISVSVGTFEAIVVGRAIQGVSGAVLPLLMGLARENVEPRRVPVTIAVVAGTVTLAGAGGFLVAGILIDTVGWQAIFVASAVLAVLAAVVCQVVLPRSPRLHRKGDRIDFVGAVLFAPALALILFGATASRTAGWGSLDVVGTIVPGLLLGAFWVWWELRHSAPLLNLRLLARRQFALTMVFVAFLGLGPIGGLILVQPVLLQYPDDAPVGLGLTATLAGAFSLGIAVLGFVFSPMSGMVAGRAGARRSALIGAGLLAAFLPGFFLFRDHLWIVGAIMLLAGIGTTFALTSIPNLIAESVPMDNMAEGMGFAVVVRSIFQSVSTSVTALILSSAVVPGTQLPQVSAFGAAVLFLALTSAGGVVAVLLMRPRQPIPEPSVDEAHDAVVLPPPNRRLVSAMPREEEPLT